MLTSTSNGNSKENLFKRNLERKVIKKLEWKIKRELNSGSQFKAMIVGKPFIGRSGGTLGGDRQRPTFRSSIRTL